MSLIARVPELERLLDGTDIATLTLTQDGETITLRRGQSPRQPAGEPRSAGTA